MMVGTSFLFPLLILVSLLIYIHNSLEIFRAIVLISEQEEKDMKNRIDDLYFGIKYWEFNSGQLKEANIFDCGNIRWSVARYVDIINNEKKVKEYDIRDPLLFIFGDVWSRCEWEFLISGMVSKKGDSPEKQSVYDMFIKPNEKLLMEMIEEITPREAKIYLRRKK